MKKPLAIILLIIGGAGAIALLALLTIFLFVIAALMIPAGGEWALYTILAGFLLLAGYPVNHLREFFKKNYNVPAPVFLACLCAPSVIVSVILRLTCPDNFDIWLASWVFSAGVFTFGVVWRAIFAAIMERIKKGNKK